MEPSCKSCLSRLPCSFCVELSCKSCFTSFCMQLLCKSRLAKLFLKVLRGTVVQKLRCKAVPQPLACSCLAKATFLNYFASFCMASSCRGRVPKLFLELFHGTVVQKVPRKAISQNFIWNCRKKALSGRGLGRSLCYVGRSQISLSAPLCTRCLVKLFLKLLHGTVVPKLPCKTIS